MADLDRPTIAVPDTPISRPGAGSPVSALSRRLSAAIAMALLGITLCQEHGGAQPVREFPTGTIIPVVVTKAEPDQTYALYLPSSYDPRRTWPVIYSNISRNGPVLPSLRAGLAMMRDTFDPFSVDERRHYATGFSGGARAAGTLAQVEKGRIAGVIGCAAGFPGEVEPTAQTPYALCGTNGNEDYNWVEMNRLDRTLASLGKPHRLLRFSGGHTWPPKDVAMAAVEWLELQAMKTGTRPKDAAPSKAGFNELSAGLRTKRIAPLSTKPG